MQVCEILKVKGATLFAAKPDQTLADAIERMARLDAGSLVVLDENKMVGMLTFREVLQAISKSGVSAHSLLIRDVMVPDPITVDPMMDANDLRRLMIEKHMRYLPVTDQNDLLGVISLLDVAKAVLEEQGLENQLLKSYIKNWPNEAV